MVVVSKIRGDVCEDREGNDSTLVEQQLWANYKKGKRIAIPISAAQPSRPKVTTGYESSL